VVLQFIGKWQLKEMYLQGLIQRSTVISLVREGRHVKAITPSPSLKSVNDLRMSRGA